MPAKNKVILWKGPDIAASYAPETASSPICFNPRTFPIDLETLDGLRTYNRVEDRVRNMRRHRGLENIKGCKNLCLKAKYPYNMISAG
jgi:hypothetical protein